MRKRFWILALLLALISAGAAGGEERDAAKPRDPLNRENQQPFEVRLIEPAEHAAVVAGSTVPIAWEAGAMPAGVEEWEAFLSIDGGKSYPIRITPHLDASIRRFHWVVPSLPGADVSILLRFGDEEAEAELPFSGRVRITGTVPRPTFRESTSGQNAARDDHGLTLTQWVEGSREGSDLRHIVVDESRLVGDHEWNRGRDHDSMPAIGNPSKRHGRALCGSRASVEAIAPSRRGELRTIPTHLADVLLLTGRLNI